MAQRNTQLVLTELLVRLFKRLWLSIWTLMVHAYVALPWLVALLLYTEAQGQFQTSLYKIASWFALKPGAESLNEGDLARAVLTVYLLVAIAWQLVKFVRRTSDKRDEQTSARHHFIQDILLTTTGWLVALPGFHREMGWGGVGIGVMMIFGSVLYFFLELQAKRIFGTLLKIMAPNNSQKQR